MATEQNPTLRSSPSSTNIYSRYQLPSSSTTTATTSILSDEEDHTEYKKSYTMDNLSALGYFTSADTMHPELTPSAAIRDRYYQSTRYLQNHSNADEEDLVYEEESIAGSILDYRPGDSELCTKPEGTPSIYSIGDSVISLRTEYNDDANSITSIRTVDDRLQGRSISHLNSFAVKTAKKVSRSGTLFRSKNGKTPEYQNEKKKLEPFMPIRDNYSKTDNSSAKTTGGMSLLSKLSKSTAPMRAKLSALSAFSSSNYTYIYVKLNIYQMHRAFSSGFFIGTFRSKASCRKCLQHASIRPILYHDHSAFISISYEQRQIQHTPFSSLLISLIIHIFKFDGKHDPVIDPCRGTNFITCCKRTPAFCLSSFIIQSS